MGLFNKPTKFVLDGAEYEHADPHPEHESGSVTRFESRTEPEVIALVPLVGGGTVEVHGYATFYSKDWVDVVWTDEGAQHMSCWVPAPDVRRPDEGEWRGRYVQF
ncbi:hypothetical protein [Pseudarthrobacter sp. NamE5]|uniref:hypothetical protein n=1 Tax=Pseudarthrobacter sp. NamE5 TaxID=2576839 RepID=UPI00110B3E7B|nr:hypothetical protein [Pseudarthrobacter sp. NamE5]TLM87194.1 hypothetical protein FDW84_05200 [Pseudarthrobacter sp. NamE5]